VSRPLHPLAVLGEALVEALERELARQEGRRADLPPLAARPFRRRGVERLCAWKKRRSSGPGPAEHAEKLTA